MISKAQQIAQETGVENKNVESMSQSKWKSQMKQKVKQLTEERAKQKMINVTKTRTIREEKWEMKKCEQ